MDAMRAAGLETGVCFSKADWNHPGYWDRARPITDRFCNYDITARPRAWASFVEYTHAQIEELLANYGRMNVLWLDAGWVRPPAEPIDMDAIVARARAPARHHRRRSHGRRRARELPHARTAHPRGGPRRAVGVVRADDPAVVLHPG